MRLSTAWRAVGGLPTRATRQVGGYLRYTGLLQTSMDRKRRACTGGLGADGSRSNIFGLAPKSVGKAEGDSAEVRKRGCFHATLNTFSFQAPDFYPKFGYRIVSTIEGFPQDYRQYTLVKDLTLAP